MEESMVSEDMHSVFSAKRQEAKDGPARRDLGILFVMEPINSVIVVKWGVAAAQLHGRDVFSAGDNALRLGMSAKLPLGCFHFFIFSSHLGHHLSQVGWYALRMVGEISGIGILKKYG